MSSKRDYVAVARVIKHQVMADRAVGDAYDALKAVAEGMAAHYGEYNPTFNRERFLKACGVAE